MGLLHKLSIFAIAAAAFGCAATGPVDSESEEDSEKEAGASAGALAVLAGTNGTITTLAHYSDGSNHPGNNSVDIGAPGGSGVWHQLDYLTADISGGEVDIYEVHEAGYCSQWNPWDEYYNGSKIIVSTRIYDYNGNLVKSHVAAFQHVDPYDKVINNTWTWNNVNAEVPRYPDGADAVYGNGSDGGIFLGWVHSVEKPVYNGPGGGLCTDGSHLHQEGSGWRAGQRYVGEPVKERYNDLHYF